MSAFTLRFAIHPWWLFWIPPSTLQLPCTEHGFTTTAVPPVETADAASEALQRRHLRRPPSPARVFRRVAATDHHPDTRHGAWSPLPWVSPPRFERLVAGGRPRPLHEGDGQNEADGNQGALGAAHGGARRSDGGALRRWNRRRTEGVASTRLMRQEAAALGGDG